MKKIFLLSLLSVFFLSAFCQTTIGNTEILTKINITKSIDDELPVALPYYPWYRFGYLFIITDYTGNIRCIGQGPCACTPFYRNFLGGSLYRGLPTDAIEKVGEAIVEESNELIAKGEYRGSLTKKIAFNDSQESSRQSYILFQMNWENDPRKPYNGQAEIIISKTKDLGVR